MSLTDTSTSNTLNLGLTGQRNGILSLNSSGASVAPATLSVDSTGNVTLQTTQTGATTNIGSGTGAISIIPSSNSNVFLSLANAGATGDFQVLINGVATSAFTHTGQVGLGTTAPSFRLDVRDAQSASAAAQIFNTDTGTNADGLIVKLGNTSTTVASTTNHFISFETSGIGIVGSIQGNGGKNVNYKTAGIADFSEYLPKDSNESIAWGALVCLGNDGYVHPCQNNADKVVGVASEFPTFTGGEDLGNGSITVGLSGVVNTQVSSANGDINPGDLITASSVPGIGVKATTAGKIIGRAVGSYSNSDTNAVGKILVLVNVGYHDPSNIATHLDWNNGVLTAQGDLTTTGQLSGGTALLGSAGQLAVDSNGNMTTTGDIAASSFTLTNGKIFSDNNGNLVNQLATDINGNNNFVCGRK
jgi:hypothetical protein